MNLPNLLTVFRIIVTPVFLILFLMPDWIDFQVGLLTLLLWILYLLIELSDVLDGYIARRQGLVTDLGKVLDPFADVLSRITYFICFTAAGLMPVVILAILLYREFSATFLRMVLMRKGVAMAASIWGKLKAVTYALAGVCGLLAVTLLRLDLLEQYHSLVNTSALIIFSLAAFASVASFITYLKGAFPILKETFAE